MHPTSSPAKLRSGSKAISIVVGCVLTIVLTIAWVGDPTKALLASARSAEAGALPTETQAFQKWVLGQLSTLHERRPGSQPSAARLELALRAGGRSFPFALECQWRNSVMGANSALAVGGEEPSFPEQGRPVVQTFMVLGIGGKADAPSALFIIPANKLPPGRVTMEYLETYRQPMTSGEFYYDPFGSTLSF